MPQDGTQWAEDGKDGWGDNPAGSKPDDCPGINGGSQHDRQGCIDSDGDGWSDADESWPASPNGSADTFPSDRTQWADSDGDGYGDNSNGVSPDSCPSVSGKSSKNFKWGCPDTDGDGFNDGDEVNKWNTDPFEGDKIIVLNQYSKPRN